MTTKRLMWAACALFAATPSFALAHTGLGDAHGFVHGFEHPVTGLDHVLAMVLVGVLAFQMGGRALWLVPVTFVSVMAIGGLLGFEQIQLPFVEVVIALSVVVLGAAVAFGIRLPVAAAVLLVGLFAVFHGHAHGMEIPETAGGLGYGLGFMTGTALLHVGGLALGYLLALLGEGRGRLVLRSFGAAAALAGVGLLAGLV